MSNELISIPWYVGGAPRFAALAECEVAYTVDGCPRLSVPRCNEHAITSAIATAQHAQPLLSAVPVADIQRVLARTMEHFLADDVAIDLVVSLTGSSRSFVRDGIRLIKDWGRSLEPFLALALPDRTALVRGSAPVVLVLPSNNVQEAPFILSQILLSRCACIVRPSQRGAAAYLATQFVAALHRTLDEMAEPQLEVLRQAISVIHTNSGDYLERLALDGWNYVFFGDSKTGEQVTRNLYARCIPRKILVYGTGLSMTVFGRSGDSTTHLNAIADSVTVNAGNECISTDILYVEATRHDEVVRQLTETLALRQTGDPQVEGSVGWVRAENAAFIVAELTRRGKGRCAQVTGTVGNFQLQPTVVPLSDYDMPVEYPGPVVSVRSYTDNDHLARLIAKDLSDNNLPCNLVTAIFAQDRAEVDAIVPLLSTHAIKINLPTHHFDCYQPHQGMYLLRELVTPTYIFAT